MTPEQKAGEPAQAGLRELASTELTALTRELCGPYEEWRSTVASFRKALAGLERLCDAATSALPEDDSKRNALTASLLDKLVATAAANTDAAVGRTRADAEAAAKKTQAEVDAALESLRVESESTLQRVRSEAQAETSRLEDANRQLHSDLQSERDRVRTLEQDLQASQNAHATAERAIEDAKATHQQTLASLESEMQSARAELEAARAEAMQLKRHVESERVARGKLADALQIVQRAVSLSEPSAPAAAPEPVQAVAPPPPQPKQKSAPVEAEPSAKLKLIKPSAATEMERELTDYVKQLFEQIQSIYNADLKSTATEDSAVVVDRLTANLRHAFSVYGRRLESSNLGESKVFEEQLAILLDAQSQTSFGRHLAIAAYSYQPQSEGGRARAEAS